MTQLGTPPFDWTSEHGARWIPITAAAAALTVAAVADGLTITDAPGANTEVILVPIAAILVAVLTAFAMSPRRATIAYSLPISLGVIASSGLCCLGSVGVESSAGATNLLLGTLAMGVLPCGVACLFALVGRTARFGVALDEGERTLLILGCAMALAGASGF
ncbi:MAG: hypothetical protein WCJ30_09730 [Deltaproteobacteria bacterium]